MFAEDFTINLACTKASKLVVVVRCHNWSWVSEVILTLLAQTLHQRQQMIVYQASQWVEGHRKKSPGNQNRRQTPITFQCNNGTVIEQHQRNIHTYMKVTQQFFILRQSGTTLLLYINYTMTHITVAGFHLVWPHTCSFAMTN